MKVGDTMKKLISMVDLQELLAENQTDCLISAETLITPAAIDLAEEKGIRFVQTKAETTAPDISFLMEALCSEPRLLQQLISVLECQPFVSEQSSGFQLIHGETIRYQTKEAETGIARQTLFDAFKGIKVEIVNLSQGLIQEFCCQEEIQFVIEGQLTTTINQKQFECNKGDSLYYPTQTERRLEVKKDSQLLVIKSKE